MNKFRRIMASMLAVAMMFSTSASAMTFSDVDSDSAAAVEKMVSLNVFNGFEDGTFKPNDEITRAQAAAVMVRLLGKKEPGKMMTDFVDVPESHWASGYVTVAASNGILKGKGNGMFDPNAKVTYAEMITMLVRALKADKVAEADEASWPDNYMRLAYDIELTDGVSFAKMAPATRGNVAILADNVLEKKIWERSEGTTKGESTYARGDETFLEDVLEIDEYKNVKVTVTKAVDKAYDANEVKLENINDKTELNGDDSTEEPGKVELASGVKFDLDGNLGNTVDVWIDKDDEVVMIVKGEDANTETVDFEEFDSVDTGDDEITVIVDGDEKTYDLADSFKAYVNSVEVDANPDASDLDGNAAFNADAENTTGTLTLDKNGDVTYIYANTYDNALVVEKIRDEKIYHNDDVKDESPFKGKDLDLDGEEYVVRDEDGNEMDVEDIEVGSVVMWKKDANELYTVLVLEDTKENGEVSSVGSDYVKVDGEKYEERAKDLLNSVDRDDVVDLYLDYNGKVLFYEVTDGGEAGSDDYGIITEFWVETDDRTAEDTLYMVITDMNGEETATLEYDDEETIEEAGASIYSILNAADASGLKGSGANAVDDRNEMMGQLVKFDVSGDDVTLEEFAGITSGDDDIKEQIGSTSYDEEDKEIVADRTYRLTDDTVIYAEKKISEDDADGNTKTEFEKVAVDNLDDFVTGDNHEVYVAEVDGREVEYVVISLDSAGEEVAKKSGDNYGILVDADETDENDDEYTLDLEIVTANGDVDTVTALEMEENDLIEAEYVGARIAYTYDDGNVYDSGLEYDKVTTAVPAKVVYFDDEDYATVVYYNQATSKTNVANVDLADATAYLIEQQAAATVAGVAGVEYLLYEEEGSTGGFTAGEDFIVGISTDGKTFKLVDAGDKKVLASVVAGDYTGKYETKFAGKVADGETFNATAEGTSYLMLTNNAATYDEFELAENVAYVEVDEDDIDGTLATEDTTYANAGVNTTNAFILTELDDIKAGKISGIDEADDDLDTESKAKNASAEDDMTDATRVWLYFGTDKEGLGEEDEVVVGIIYEDKE
ncbi:MAG: S-layer homology domain-containing protein [Clostridia bacterium]|jgi:hypothetical protein|nr:S-layer homology domain-containing protein [Clostridia bacterium]